LALIPDLLFGSQVQGALASVGHDVELICDPEQGAKALAGLGGKSRPVVLVIDLDSDEFDGFDFVESRKAVGALTGTRILGFYPHMNGDTRTQAEQAEIDLVVPRSRMAREGAGLVTRLADEPLQ
jgi:hypothetical protein